MSELTQGIFIALIPALIVSIITSYITVRLSMKQFYSQRWWEKKAEAYSHIIEHLSYLQYYYGEWIDKTSGRERLRDKDNERLLEEGYKHAKEFITKAVAIGAYIVSDDTAATLTKLSRELEKEDPRGDWISDIDKRYGLVKEYIARIREHAKADLSNK